MSKVTGLRDWKIGDKFHIVQPGYEKYSGEHTVSKVSSSCIHTTSLGGLAFLPTEIVKIESPECHPKTLAPDKKVLIVDKNRPEYSLYVECTKEDIDKFFFGTRIFDFYIIKDGTLIELKHESNIRQLYEVET